MARFGEQDASAAPRTNLAWISAQTLADGAIATEDSGRVRVHTAARLARTRGASAEALRSASGEPMSRW